MIKLYGFPLSGNTQKIRVALGLLGLDYEEITLAGGAHKQTPFIDLNPLGQVPVLVDGTTTLRDSQAILVYLAATHRPGNWDGRSPAEKARIASWLSLAANEIAHGPVRLRLAGIYGTAVDREAALAVTNRLLPIFETQLSASGWLEGERLTIADLACAPYLALAHQGGVDLTGYPAIRRWTGRIANLPGFRPIEGWQPGADEETR